MSQPNETAFFDAILDDPRIQTALYPINATFVAKIAEEHHVARMKAAQQEIECLKEEMNVLHGRIITARNERDEARSSTSKQVLEEREAIAAMAEETYCGHYSEGDTSLKHFAAKIRSRPTPGA